jgi:hypothetical protein
MCRGAAHVGDTISVGGRQGARPLRDVTADAIAVSRAHAGEAVVIGPLREPGGDLPIDRSADDRAMRPRVSRCRRVAALKPAHNGKACSS